MVRMYEKIAIHYQLYFPTESPEGKDLKAYKLRPKGTLELYFYKKNKYLSLFNFFSRMFSPGRATSDRIR